MQYISICNLCQISSSIKHSWLQLLSNQMTWAWFQDFRDLRSHPSQQRFSNWPTEKAGKSWCTTWVKNLYMRPFPNTGSFKSVEINCHEATTIRNHIIYHFLKHETLKIWKSMVGRWNLHLNWSPFWGTCFSLWGGGTFCGVLWCQKCRHNHPKTQIWWIHQAIKRMISSCGGVYKEMGV